MPIDTNNGWSQSPVAVLVSGGVDSAILLIELAKAAPWVVPLYVRSGMVWESAEEAALRRFLRRVSARSLQPLSVLDAPVGPIYGRHWSLTGEGTPDEASSDEAVYLPGRNLLLLSQAAVWCHLHEVPTIAMAPLAANPFPDCTDAFFAAFEHLVSLGLETPIRVIRPYQQLNKVQVLARGAGLPLEDTFSCIRPVRQKHCGRCNKCAERQLAFAQAGLADKTSYATNPNPGECQKPCTA